MTFALRVFGRSVTNSIDFGLAAACRAVRDERLQLGDELGVAG